jgi:Xaa-Pro aminopeptidase
MDRYEVRRKKLVRLLRPKQLAALLVTNFTNVSYLTGFSGDDSYLLLTRSDAILISDSRYATQIEEECPELKAEIRPTSEAINDTVVRVAGRMKLKKLGFESHATTVEQWHEFQKKLEGVELVPVSALVEELRVIKDADEIREIREAVRQAERGFDILRASLTPEMTELQASHQLEDAMRKFGAIRSSFESIVAVGARAALPHYRPGNRRIGEADFVLIDWGASNAHGYKSDLTRVLVTGKISTKLSKVYRVVLTAQRRAIDKIRAGVRACDVDATARSVIEEAGYGKNFGHGLGHGIGLNIHEQPRLSPAGKGELRAGMVVTVEPGIYVPGWGGVRIEDDVLVTREGCEVLSSVPKELEESVLG